MLIRIQTSFESQKNLKKIMVSKKKTYLENGFQGSLFKRKNQRILFFDKKVYQNLNQTIDVSN